MPAAAIVGRVTLKPAVRICIWVGVCVGVCVWGGVYGREVCRAGQAKIIPEGEILMTHRSDNVKVATRHPHKLNQGSRFKGQKFTCPACQALSKLTLTLSLK